MEEAKSKAATPDKSKKPFLESVWEKFRKVDAKQACKSPTQAPTAVKKRKSNINFEKRIAKLEYLIKKLQTEICELTTHASESLADLQRKSRGNISGIPIQSSNDAGSAYSCSPCQIKTIIVKDINFTQEDIMTISNKIPEFQNIFDFEASSSSSDPRNKSIGDDDKDYDTSSVMEEEIDKLIYELKSEICNKLGSARELGRALNNSKEDIP